MSNHVLVRMEMVLVSVQDGCMVCAKMSNQMILLGDEAQVEARFGPFGDSAILDS